MVCRAGRRGSLEVDGDSSGEGESGGILTGLNTSGNLYIGITFTHTTCPPSLSFLSVFSFQSRASIVGLRAEIQSCRPKAKWGQSGRSTPPGAKKSLFRPLLER